LSSYGYDLTHEEEEQLNLRTGRTTSSTLQGCDVYPNGIDGMLYILIWVEWNPGIQ
jgi:hypothetical protein